MVMCKHSEGKQRAYPFILLLYLEKNMQDGEDECTCANTAQYTQYSTRSLFTQCACLSSQFIWHSLKTTSS